MIEQVIERVEDDVEETTVELTDAEIEAVAGGETYNGNIKPF